MQHLVLASYFVFVTKLVMHLVLVMYFFLVTKSVTHFILVTYRIFNYQNSYTLHY
jgi:hypothetical protein